MSTTKLQTRRLTVPTDGIGLVAGMAGLMWIIEIINTIDSNNLNTDGGIHPRNVGRLWEILTAPFLHASFAHLIGNTIPFVVMGVIIALRGAARVAAVTAIVIVIGGLGTWLIAASNSVTFGASGVVFGYAGYLLARGVFNRSALELLTGAVVAALFGTALLSSLVPHPGISWQGHLCGAIGGVIAAYVLANDRSRGAGGRPGGGTTGGSGTSSSDGTGSDQSALDRLLAR
jgi:membrane associated rhomboid family serine protease